MFYDWRILLLSLKLQWLVSSATANDLECQEALGMESRAISDQQISASSEWDSDHAAIQGRLHFQKSGSKQGSWCAGANTADQWLQIDLRVKNRITRVGTQGRNGAHSQWVTMYKLQYGDDGVKFQYYREEGQIYDKLFVGNSDEDTVVSHDLNPPIIARFIRFRPVFFNNHISMRAEVYGCKVDFHWDFSSSGGRHFLDESNHTKTYAVGSGLYVGADTLFVTGTGHLEIQRSGEDLYNNGDELGVSFWIKHKGHISVSLRSLGGPSHYPYIIVNDMDYSPGSEGINFVVVDYDSGEVLFVRGFEASDTVQQVEEFIKILPESAVVLMTMHATSIQASPIGGNITQLVTDLGGNISNTFTDWYCLIGFYGLETFPWIAEQRGVNGDACEISSAIKIPVCSKHLGMQNSFIESSQITASSTGNNTKPFYGGLGKKREWCSNYKEKRSFLQVDLVQIHTLTYIATQGSGKKDAWVTSYLVEYSVDGVEWFRYKEADETYRVFSGNSDGSSIVRHRLFYPIQTRFLRLRALTSHRRTCLRMEIYGCLKDTTELDVKKPKFGLIGPTELSTFTEAEVIIRGYYQYCWDGIMDSDSLSRQPYVMLFGECRCLASSVTPNCENVTQFETRLSAPEEPGTYTIMMGESIEAAGGCGAADEITNVINVGTLQVRKQKRFARSCLEAKTWNGSDLEMSGIFKINPQGEEPFDVYCEDEWTVVQRRRDGSVNFNRGWQDYKEGFGDLSGEFWVGNDKLHILSQTPSVLLVELQNANGEDAFAMYELFHVDSHHENYQLKVNNYRNGTAGDALGSLNGALFSAKGVDNDGEKFDDCATKQSSAWWYDRCVTSVSVDLNGVYSRGILWDGWSPDHHITSVTMKIKPKRDIVCSEESCYKLSDSVKTWHDYVESCPAGSTPVKITNQYQQNIVSEFWLSSPWIGLYKQGNNLYWSDNEPAERFLFFLPGVSLQGPNNCFNLRGNQSHWNKEDCNSKEYFVCEKENNLTLLELNIGKNDSLSTISLVYNQHGYHIQVKQNTSLQQLTIDRTTSFNEWTRVSISINQTSGILKYSEDGVIVAEMWIEQEVPEISWSSAAIGISHSLADTGFMKSFALRKLQIVRSDATNDSFHKNVEMEKNQRFGSEVCEYEKINIPDVRHDSPGCSIANYNISCSEVVGSTDTLIDKKQKWSVKVREKTSWISPYISDMYGCLSLWCNAFGSILYVYVKNIDEEEKLITYYYIRDKEWVHLDNIRLKSFTRGPYQIRLFVKYSPIWFDIDNLMLRVGNCQPEASLIEGFENSFLRDFPRLTNYLQNFLLGVGDDWRPCYNATADGWDPEVFHNKCDHKPLTVFLARANSWWIFSGKTYRPWNGYFNSSTLSPHAALYTLRNFQGSGSPYELEAKKDKGKIFNNINYGPTFDVDLQLIGDKGTSDLGNAFSSRSKEERQDRPKSAYLAGSFEFELSELEVYYSGSTSYSSVKACFAGNVLLRPGEQLTCQLGGSKDIENIYLETGCDTDRTATFEITFNDHPKTMVYFKDVGCGTILTHRLKVKPGGFAKGATEITVKLSEYHRAVNETSIQAIGWTGEIDPMESLFQSLEWYWSLDNTTQTVNRTSNATSHTQLMKALPNVTQHTANESGREINFGVVNHTCVICLDRYIDVCPDGLTVFFWLRLWKTRPATPLKILGFGQPNEEKVGFLVMELEDEIMVRMITMYKKCEIQFDIIDGAWTHIALTFRHHMLKGYRNGELVANNNLCVLGTYTNVEQPLSSGTAVAALDELMIWHTCFTQDTITSVFEYSIGKPAILWVNVEVTFPDKNWDDFFNEMDKEKKHIENQLNKFFKGQEYSSSIFLSARPGSVIVNVSLSFYSMGLDQILKLDESFFRNDSSAIFADKFNVTGVMSSHVPMEIPNNVTATSCSDDPLCLLVSWESLSASYVERLNGVFQGYTVLYREEGEPFEQLLVPPQETERHEVQLTNLKGYTSYTMQVMVATINGPGFPSTAVTVRTGESAPSAPPQDLTALNITSTSIEVSWSPVPPQFINAAQLVGYTVYWWKVNDSTINVTSTVEPRVWLTGLEAYSEYNVTVSAMNYIGNGPNSSFFTVSTLEEALKNPPQNVSGFNTSSTSIHLSWLPISHEPRVDYFKVTLTEVASGIDFMPININDVQVIIVSLDKYTEYEFTVCGVNSQGDGPTSPPVNISTDMDVPSAPPTQLEVSNSNSSHIRLRWLPVSSIHINAPVLLGYVVNYKETGSEMLLTNKTDNTWIELFLPNNNTKYLFTVSGYNERGLGPNVSLAYFFFSLNASGTGNDSLIDYGSNTTNTSGSSNTTLPAFSVPDPIAFYPLNSTYGTQEINNRLPQGTPVGVSLAPGPNGMPGGSYQFTQQSNSYIEFPNNGGLDAQYSITMLCWIYPQNSAGPIFNYVTNGNLWGVHLWMVQAGKLFARFSSRNYQLTPPLTTSQPLDMDEWYFIGASYDYNTGIARLWVNGELKEQKDIGAGTTLATRDNVRMGVKGGDGRYYKGRIAAMRVYDVALTGEQIIAVRNAYIDQDVNNTLANTTDAENTNSTINGSSNATINGTDANNTLANTTDAGNSNSTINGSSNTAIDGTVDNSNSTVNGSMVGSSNITINQTVANTTDVTNGTVPTPHSKTSTVKKETPLEPPINVNANNHTSPYSLLVTWEAIPPASRNGIILGYKVSYRPVLESGQTDIDTESLVVTVMPPEQSVLLTGLRSFTVYRIEVLGFNEVGDGPLSIPIYAETCRCPSSFTTNWWHNPPYMIRDDQSEAIFPFIIQNMVPFCCQRCQAHGTTVVHVMKDGTKRAIETEDHNGVRSSVDQSDLSFPLAGYQGQQHFMGQFGFLAIVKSPSVVFIVPKEDSNLSSMRLFSSVFQCWPVMCINLCIVFLSGIIIWKLDSSKNPEEFPKSFMRGTLEGIWWTFVTMTTVGYGDRTPRSALGRVFSVTSTLIGLVTIAVLLGSLTSTLTTDIVFSDVTLYGTKVAAVHNSSEFLLGLRKNAKMNQAKKYKNLDEVYKALQSREVEGALVDALVAGSRGDLFNTSDLRILKTLHHSSVYGAVLAGDAKKLQQCFSDFMKENAAEISAHVASKTSVIKPSAKSAAVEQAMNLFHPENALFLTALWCSLKILAFLTVCGLTWEVIRAVWTFRERRRVRHQEREVSCLPQKWRSEMENTVTEFYTNAKEIFERFSAKHKEERKEFVARAKRVSNSTKKRKYVAWS